MTYDSTTTDDGRHRDQTSEIVQHLRTTFDGDAERYDRARPGYPAALYDDLAALAGIGPGCRVLEIGCGTGQATVPLAERGCEIVAVELGAELAEVARRNLARFPKAEVVTAAFEAWSLPPEPFDVVLSATAFHWIDPAVRVVKSADALKPDGYLATIATHHVASGTDHDRFFADVQDCYERWDPATPPGLRLAPSSAIPMEGGEIEHSGRFEAPRFLRHETDIPYTSETYIDVLLTYSGHRALEPARQRGLLDCIAGLIDGRYGGRIVKRYLSELRLARRI
jgi:SAM-dependent methyltransferase